MGLMQRNKGKAFERKVAEAFRAVFPNVHRTLTQQRDSGEAPDIDAPGLWVEAKHYRRANIQKAYDQACEELKRHKVRRNFAGEPAVIPIAVTKDNRREPLVTLSLENFLHLLEEREKGRAYKAELGELGNKVADLQLTKTSIESHLAALDTYLDVVAPARTIEETRVDRMRRLVPQVEEPETDKGALLTVVAKPT